MTRLGWMAVALLAIGAGVALLPLRLAINASGGNRFGAQAVDGTIWRGRITGATVGGVVLGDLDTRAQFWPLGLGFTGAALSGTITRTGVADLRGAIGPVAQLPFARIAFDGVSVTGATAASGCSTASGKVSVVPAMLPEIGELSGPLTCDNGRLRAVMTPTVGGDAGVDIAIGVDRRFTATLTIGSVPALARIVLIAAGFEDTPQGLRLTREGQL